MERIGYDAYGNQSLLDADGTAKAATTVGNQYSYTGRRLDSETGLMYFRARYYDPNTGEFIARDPLGYVDGMSQYRGYFVPGMVDPSGLNPLKGIGKWLLKKFSKKPKQPPKKKRKRSPEDWFWQEQSRRKQAGKEFMDSDIMDEKFRAAPILGAEAADFLIDSTPIVGDLREAPSFIKECGGLLKDLNNMIESRDKARAKAERLRRERWEKGAEERKRLRKEWEDKEREFSPSRWMA